MTKRTCSCCHPGKCRSQLAGQLDDIAGGVEQPHIIQRVAALGGWAKQRAVQLHRAFSSEDFCQLLTQLLAGKQLFCFLTWR